MTQAVIEVDGVAKWYRTRLRRDWLLMRPLARRKVGDDQTGIWALNDVSVKLEHGRSLGVVGNNGAGKTTLMRLMAGISRPTRGHVRVNGRVAVRFGYGLAFNPYLTGRENVFVEGTLLGLTNREVRQSLDDIVDFAGLDGAIDRPLWTYSSGMVSRLGFAVASRIESDVLLLDEALSAGDGSFRQRSEQVLTEARESGRSLVIVSHGLSLVRRLCDDGLWLERGVARAFGPVDEVVDAYEESAELPTSRKKEGENDSVEENA
jgi:ABC-type polysaccharide/polyol phosphate transport system ATPase subunit